MAAGTGITATNIDVVRNTAIDISVSQMTAATNAGTAGGDTDFFTFTCPKADQQIVFLINNGTGATITAKFLNGAMWGSVGDSAAVSIATGKTYAWTIDSAKYKTAAGTIKLLLTPTAGTALSASTKANVTAICLGQ